MDLTMERAPDLEFDDSTEEFEKGRLYGVEQGRKEERKRIVAMVTDGHFINNLLQAIVASWDASIDNDYTERVFEVTKEMLKDRIEQKEGDR